MYEGLSTVRFPLHIPRFMFGAEPPTIEQMIKVQMDHITFVRAARTLWTCYSCKEANLDWEGRDNDLSNHVDTHQCMARWFYSLLRRNEN